MFPILAVLAPITVGVILTATATIKAVRPAIFRAHLSALGWMPANLLNAGVVGACLVEGAWGAGLIIGYRPSILFPITVIGFAILSIISWNGVKSGKTEDCGCYGGVISPSIYQSVGLNVTYSGLIVLAWLGYRDGTQNETWRIIIVASSAVALGLLAGTRLQKDISQPPSSPLRLGLPWNRSWSGGTAARADSEVLISFLGPDCPHCKRWVKIANAMVHSPHLPDVLGVVSVDDSRLQKFKNDYEIKFPVVRISRSRMLSLAPAVPTSVLVSQGTIAKIWIGNMPPDFSERFISAFFETSGTHT